MDLGVKLRVRHAAGALAIPSGLRADQSQELVAHGISEETVDEAPREAL